MKKFLRITITGSLATCVWLLRAIAVVCNVTAKELEKFNKYLLKEFK